mgnify:CR=1 FL=1
MKQYPDGLTYETYDGGRITKATLAGTELNVYMTVSRLCKDSGFYPNLDLDDIQLRPLYRGVAKVNPEYDQPNQEVGEELARERAMEKYHRDFDRKFNFVMEQLAALEARFLHYAERHQVELDYRDSDYFLDFMRQGGGWDE